MEQETPNPQTVTKQKKLQPKNIFIFLLVLLLIAAVAVGAYMYRDQKATQQLEEKQATITQQAKKIAELEAELAAAKKTSTEASSNTETASIPSTKTVENIKAAITSGNTASLEGYMAPTIMVIVAASEGIGNRTPTQAIADLSYISGSKNWNFNLDTATLASYKSGFYKDYFKDTSIVGRASDGKVIVFNFNSQGKINGIFLVASDELLTQ